MFNERCRACNTILTEEELEQNYCSGCIDDINTDLEQLYKIDQDLMAEETKLFADDCYDD